MNKPWQYAENVFFNITEHNYEAALKISEFHYNALGAVAASDAFFAAMAAYFKPFHDSYETTFTTWKNSGGSQKGDTLSLGQLLLLSTPTLNGWEPAITTVYPKGSAGYVKLYPQGRKTFTNGSKDDRIAAFSTLAKALALTPALAAVQTEAQTFWQQLHDARGAQQQSMSSTGTGSADVEAARVAMCDAMFQDLGNIMAIIITSETALADFFDLQSIRHHEQVIFERQVKAGANVFIVKHTFAATDQIELANKGSVPLYFYLGMLKTTPFDEKGSVQVAANTTMTIATADMGAPANAYLFVHNNDANMDGDCEVEFL